MDLDRLIHEILFLQLFDLFNQLLLLSFDVLLLFLELHVVSLKLFLMEFLNQLFFLFFHLNQPLFVLLALSAHGLDLFTNFRLFLALCQLLFLFQLKLHLPDFFTAFPFLLLELLVVYLNHRIILLNPAFIFFLPVLSLGVESVSEPLDLFLVGQL